MSNAPKNALTAKKRDTAGLILRCIIVFLVPLITGIIIFKKKEISPFGGNDLLSIDLWGQYFPMYRKFGLDHGFSEAMYNWSGALGFNNWVQNAFYTRSIFLIPFGLVPLEHSITYIDIVCLLRFGLGALACQLFFEYKFRSSSPIIMAASIGYGLCSYSTAFIMQFMWTDGLFLAPLVLLGLEMVMRGRSPLLYTFMLALTIYTNFYTGFGVCLFTGFYFLAEWITREHTDADGKSLRGLANIKARGKMLGRFLLYSLLGGIMTAFVLLPTVKGLGNSESANEGRLDFSQWYHTLAENVSSMLPTTSASLEYGVANIAVGLFAFILIPLYFMNTRIKFKEKLCTGGFLFLLYAGLNYNPMDWLFNGFHFPNQLPGRWSFLFSFAIVIIAANGIAKYKGIEPKSIISALLIGTFFVGYAKFGNPSQEKLDTLSHWNMLIAAFAVLMIISVAFSYMAEIAEKKAVKAEEAAKLAEEEAAMTADAENDPEETTEETADEASEEDTEEASEEDAEEAPEAPKVPNYRARALAFRCCAFAISLVLGIGTAGEVCKNVVAVSAKEGAGLPVSNMESYIKVTDVIYRYGSKYDSGSDDLYRVEANDGWTFNTSMLGDFKGIGYYGSTLNHGVYELLQDMGNRVYANNVSTVYNSSSLFQNSLFGIRYIVDRGKYFGTRTGKGYNLAEDAEDCLVWENPTALPIAFAASGYIKNMTVDPQEIKAITTQNDMLNKLCGEEANVFEHLDPTEFISENCEFSPSENWNTNYFYRSDDTQPVHFVWTYTVPNDNPIYLEQNFRAGTMTVNGTENIDIGAEKFRCIGSYPAGTQVQIEYSVPDINIGCFGLEVYSYNMDKWNEIYNRLSAQGLNVTSFKNTRIEGTLTANQSGMIFTTIPQDGGWRVYVDGKKVEDYETLGTLIAFDVDAGQHEIVFKYHVPAFAAGLLLTLAALAVTVLCYLIWRKGGLKLNFKKAEKSEPAEEKAAEEKPAEKSKEKFEADKNKSEAKKDTNNKPKKK